MSVLKFVKITNLLQKNISITYINFRSASHWNKDWKPAPYPKNEKERLEAAKKYGVHPSEYEPYPDDGFGWGDYPKLPKISVDAKDPYYPYDLPEFRRNFNEPVHVDFDIMGEDRINFNERPRYSLLAQASCFFGVMTLSYLIFFWLNQYPMHLPAYPQQVPGLTSGKHYTFEPEN